MVQENTIVWIANRETPLNTTSGLIKLNSKGNLVILNASDNIVWSSKSSTSVENPETSVIMQLLDSGNLVVRYETDGAPENYLWQSLIYLGMLIYQVANLGGICAWMGLNQKLENNGMLQIGQVDVNMSLEECKRLCLKNCSCTAYANTDIRGSGSGCLLWFDELTDIREFNENGQDLYVRKALSKFTAPVLEPLLMQPMASLQTLSLEKVALGLSISGFMSPEYATDGIFSVKSDVFSFGVLLIEIVSGQNEITAVENNDTWVLEPLLAARKHSDANRYPEGISLSLRNYALPIISEVGLPGSKRAPTEQNHHIALAKENNVFDPESYRSLIC
ncbi:hypothetical protein AgCh_001590 [Apium graveolens]